MLDKNEKQPTKNEQKRKAIEAMNNPSEKQTLLQKLKSKNPPRQKNDK